VTVNLTEEEPGRLVNAAQRYDHEHRLRGHGWTRVSDQQAARLILGALGAMASAANPPQPNGAPS
jgi:hypothetical protein